MIWIWNDNFIISPIKMGSLEAFPSEPPSLTHPAPVSDDGGVGMALVFPLVGLNHLHQGSKPNGQNRKAGLVHESPPGCSEWTN